MQKTLTRGGLDSNMLKLIAIAAMTADHIAWLLFPGYPTDPLPIILHIIGRLTCPIMCFFIAEGYHYTRDIKKYTARLFVFAVICLLYTSPSPRDLSTSRMPSSA